MEGKKYRGEKHRTFRKTEQIKESKVKEKKSCKYIRNVSEHAIGLPDKS